MYCLWTSYRRWVINHDLVKKKKKIKNVFFVFFYCALRGWENFKTVPQPGAFDIQTADDACC